MYGEVTKVTYNNKWYASKVIHKKLLPGYPDVSPDDIKKLVKEISLILPTVKHPNVENIEAIVQLSPTCAPILLSEFLPHNLSTFIDSMQGSLPLHTQIDLCQDMAKGLAFLQDARILHINLHGHNVLLSTEPRAKIADYVCPLVCKSVDNTVSAINQYYLAPEVVKAKQPPTELSAVFSLGVLFLQTVTGQSPSPSGELELVEIERRKQDLQKMSANHPLLPTIQQCLRDSESERPSVTKLLNLIPTDKDRKLQVRRYLSYN